MYEMNLSFFVLWQPVYGHDRQEPLCWGKLD